MNRRLLTGASALAFFSLFSYAASAQIAISANDAKAGINDGKGFTVQNPPADSITIFDLGQNPPKLLGEVSNVPASVVGPPQSVAIAPDASFALVTGARVLDPSDPKKVVPGNSLAVIDLKAKPAAVSATVETGKGPAGVSINPAGTLAIVANRSDGTISIYKIAGKTLTPAGKMSLGDNKSGPSLAVFSPDGKTVLVTRDGDHKISVLKVDGDKVEDTKHVMTGGYRPYSIDISPKGDVAVVGNQGGGSGDEDTINVIDMKSNPPHIVDTISVGQIPEGVAMSPKGDFVAVTIMNGSNKPKAFPFHHDHGLLKVFGVNGTKLSLAAEAPVGHWCQGVAWSRDGKTLAVQCMVEKELQFYRFDGSSLKREDSVIKLKGGGAGLRAAN